MPLYVFKGSRTNVIISGKLLKYYPMLPFIGRMDDIWGAYYLQFKLNNKVPFIIFSSASVYQKRNQHKIKPKDPKHLPKKYLNKSKH